MARTPRKAQIPGETAAAPVEETVAEQQTQAEETAAAPVYAGGMMDADDVDPTQITSAVLTRQGWVVPAK